MKTLLTLLTLLLFIPVIFASCQKEDVETTLSDDGEEIIWANATFQSEVSKMLRKPIGTIRQSDLDTITELNLALSRISNISDIVHFKNLRTLYLGLTNISDISPLASLTNLTKLDLHGNKISDISPLASLTNLVVLDLSSTDISDISALAGLTNLTELELNYTKISDISPLVGLTNLTKLALNTDISDIKPLANLTNLTTIFFGQVERGVFTENHNISDWSPVDHVETVLGQPPRTEEIDGEKYFVYEEGTEYTVYSTESIWTSDSYPITVLLDSEAAYRLHDSVPDPDNSWGPSWRDSKFILQIKNQEGRLLSLDYKNFIWEDVVDHRRGINIQMHPQTDYFDVLLYSDANYYLFRFDFKDEKVSLLSKASMSSFVTKLLGLNLYGLDDPFSADTHKFYEYTLEKGVTEDMFVIPEGGELVFHEGGEWSLSSSSFKYAVEKDKVTLNLTDTYNISESRHRNSCYPLIIEDVEITTKSALQEGETLYSAENMKDFSNTPWVSGMADFTQEEIVLESKSLPFDWLIIGNGFYREDRPDLFFENNRAKEIQIIYEGYENSIAHTVILQDTESEQYFSLMYRDCKKITIKILSVYSGTKYDDTCINSIVAMQAGNSDTAKLLPGER